MDLLERKLSVLRQQKQLLLQEIADNEELGRKVGCCDEFLNFTADIIVCVVFHFLGRLFDRVDLIKPISNVRPSVCMCVLTSICPSTRKFLRFQ